ncbi:MAG: nitrilase-related carbon-nitrogen hydrolase [Planctomycetota bacterium]
MRARVALLQADWPEMDRAGNRARAEHGLREARAEGAGIFALPELWSCGYDLEAVAGVRDWEVEVEFLRHESSRGPAILGGSFPEWRKGSERPGNCAVAFEAAREVARYRKVHLFGPLGESKYFEAGDARSEVFTLAGLRCAQAICYDLRFPELFRVLAGQGVELVAVCAQWPIARIQHWRTLLMARAIENQCYVLGVNRLGTYGGVRFGGNSLLVDPTGLVIIDAGEGTGLFAGEIDVERVRRVRREFPVLEDRRHDLYE